MLGNYLVRWIQYIKVLTIMPDSDNFSSILFGYFVKCRTERNHRCLFYDFCCVTEEKNDFRGKVFISGCSS